MPNKVEITISEKSDVKVTHTQYTKGNDTIFEFENIVITIPEIVSKDMQEKHEKAVIAEEYWYQTMQAEQDRLNARIEELEEILSNMGYQEAV